MSYRSEFGIIDPQSYLASGQVEEWVEGYDLAEDKVDQINDEIDSWVERDPEGYSDYEAMRLDNAVYAILQR